MSFFLLSQVTAQLARFLFSVTFSLLLAAGVSAQPVKVSGTLPSGADGVRGDFIVSRDGRFVAYSTVGGGGLFVVRQSSGSVTTIVDETVNVRSFTFTPNSDRIVFRATITNPSTDEVYSASTSGGLVTKLLASTVTTGEERGYSHFAISPDGLRVVALGRRDTSSPRELWSVPIAGGEPIRLSGTFAEEGGVRPPQDFKLENESFAIAPDSSRVVFLATNSIDPRLFSLFVVPITGGNPVALSTVDGVIDPVKRFQLSPDGLRVAYATRSIGVVTTFSLFSVMIATGERALVASTTSDSTSNAVFKFTPDGECLLHKLSRTDSLRSFSLTEGTSLVLGGPLVLDSEVSPSRFDLDFTPDSERVIFWSRIDDRLALVSMRTKQASTPVNLTPINVGDDASAYQFAVMADGRYAVFIIDVTGNGIRSIRSVDLTVPNAIPVSLHGAINSGVSGQVSSFKIAPNSRRVVYRNDYSVAESQRLTSSKIDGSENTTISGSFVADGDVTETYYIGEDSSRVFFLADKITNDRDEVFRVQIGGSELLADIDGDDIVRADTDAVIAMRRLLGFSGSTLTSGARGVNSLLSLSNAAMSERARVLIEEGATLFSPSWLDIDRDDEVTLTRDLLVFTRYLLGIRGQALVAKALPPTTDVAAIEARIEALLEVRR
jgi:Tol biopolymer transport system component